MTAGIGVASGGQFAPIPGMVTTLVAGQSGPPPVQMAGLDTATTRVVLTVAILVGLASGWLLVRKVGQHARKRYDGWSVETVEMAVLTVLVGGAATAIVVVWDAASQIRRQVTMVATDELLAVRLVVSLLFLAVAYGIVRIAGRVVRGSTDPGETTDHRREVAYHVVQVSVYALSVLFVLAVWRVNLGNLLVGAGFLGIVVGLAARQTLGAVIAGFVLLFARPFEVGEWVEIGDREGVVTDVSIVNTRLRTLDDEHVLIPNDRVTSRDVVNRSREGKLRVTVEVGVDYGTDLERAMSVAEEAMADCAAVIEAPAPHVVGKGFGDSAVVLELRFWIENPSARRMWRARTAVVETVKTAFEAEGISIPFPQRTLGARGGSLSVERSGSDGAGTASGGTDADGGEHR